MRCDEAMGCRWDHFLLPTRAKLKLEGIVIYKFNGWIDGHGNCLSARSRWVVSLVLGCATLAMNNDSLTVLIAPLWRELVPYS